MLKDKSKSVRDLTTGNIYSSAAEASRAIGMNRSSVAWAIAHNTKAGGHEFAYIDNTDLPEYDWENMSDEELAQIDLHVPAYDPCKIWRYGYLLQVTNNRNGKIYYETSFSNSVKRIWHKLTFLATAGEKGQLFDDIRRGDGFTVRVAMEFRQESDKLVEINMARSLKYWINYWAETMEQPGRLYNIFQSHATTAGQKFDCRCVHVKCVETGEVFRSTLEAGELLGFTSGSSVQKALDKADKVAGGYHWVRVDRIFRILCVETGFCYDDYTTASEAVGLSETRWIAEAIDKPNKLAAGYHWQKINIYDEWKNGRRNPTL